MLRSSLRSLSGNILIFGLSDLLGNFARSMVFPYASLYILSLGGNAAQIGLVALVSQMAGLVLLPVAGYITDHSDRVRIIVLAGFLSSFFLLINVFAPSWEYAALAGLLVGIVVFQFPAYSSLIADSLPVGGRGQGLGMLNTLSNSLAIFAPFLAGVVIERYSPNLGMRYLYAAMLLLNLAGSFIQLRFLRETAHAPRTPLRLAALLDALTGAYKAIPALVRAMPTPLRALALVVVLSFMGTALTGSFWVVYATQELKLNTAEWGLILLVESVVRVALFLPAGLLVDRWGRTTTLALALVIWIVVTPMFVLLNGFAAVLIERILLAVAFVLAIPASAALMADLVPRAVRGQMMAAIGQGGIVLGLIGTPGGPAVGYLIIPPLMVASYGGGLLYTLNPAAPWFFSTAAGLVALVLLVIFIRDPKHAEH